MRIKRSLSTIPFYLVVAVSVILSQAVMINTARAETSVVCDESGEPVQINFGDHTTGCEVNPQTDLDRFTFDCSADDLIRVSVQSRTGHIDPRLELRDPGATLLEDTYCVNTPCTYSLDISCPVSGTYHIFISDSNTDEKGEYLFEINRIFPGPVPAATEVELGTAIRDTLDENTDMDFFEFEGETDDLIRISVQSRTGHIDPRVELWDPDGNLLKDTYCVNTPCTYSFDLLLPTTGTYLIAVSDSNTDENGDYLFEINELSPGPVPAATEVELGTAVRDTLDENTDMDFFEFEGETDDLIRISVQSRTGHIDPRVELWDPDGNLLKDTYCVNTPCTYSFDLLLPTTGTYLIAVSDSNTDENGDYLFEINELSPGPVPAATEVELGTAIRDTLDENTDMDFFEFEGETDDLIRISVQSRTGHIDPRVELWDPDGNLLKDTYCVNTPCTYSFDLLLPTTGTYLIAMSDSNTDENGDYLFEVNRLSPVVENPYVLTYGCSVDNVLDENADMDFYLLEGDVDDLIRISVQSLTGHVDPRFELWDPDGNLLEDTYCVNTPCTYSLDLIVPTTGTYLIAMSDSNTDEKGSYQIGLQCLLGDCPITIDDTDCDAVPDERDNCVEISNTDQWDANWDEDDNTSKADDQHYGNVCDTDYDNDGFVGLPDFNDLRTCFGEKLEDSPECDIIDCDGDGFIGLPDFNCLRSYFGRPPGPGIGD